MPVFSIVLITDFSFLSDHYFVCSLGTLFSTKILPKDVLSLRCTKEIFVSFRLPPKRRHNLRWPTHDRALVDIVTKGNLPFSPNPSLVEMKIPLWLRVHLTPLMCKISKDLRKRMKKINYLTGGSHHLFEMCFP